MANHITSSFEIPLEMLSASRQKGATAFSLGKLTIYGVGRFYPEEESGNKMDYEIVKISFNGMDVLPVLSWMEDSISEIDEIHEAIMNHLPTLFLPQ
jgi:hypothetical protein